MAKTGEFVLFVRKRKKKHAAGDAMKAKRFFDEAKPKGEGMNALTDMLGKFYDEMYAIVIEQAIYEE